MPLKFDLTRIPDYERVCYDDDDRIRPVTELLIFSTITVGLGELTDKNIEEFIARFRVIEKLQGPMLTKGDGEPWFVSNDDFIAHIGLTANVRNETRLQWAKRMFIGHNSIPDEFSRAFRADQKRVVKAS